MYALIRCGDGAYYTSLVFGYFCPITATDDYQRYLERTHNQYYLVLNQDKTKLIPKHVFPSDSIYLVPNVLLVDADFSDWVVDENGHGCIGLLNGLTETQLEQALPDEVLAQLIELDAAYQYEDYPAITCQTDIDNLMVVSGYFHDAAIEKLIPLEDGSVYLLFQGIWGCRLEMWWSDEVSYCADSRDPEQYDPYWSGATMLRQDGWIYLVDEDGMKVSQMDDNYCWFKAKRVTYHVIPL